MLYNVRRTANPDTINSWPREILLAPKNFLLPIKFNEIKLGGYLVLS